MGGCRHCMLTKLTAVRNDADIRQHVKVKMGIDAGFAVIRMKLVSIDVVTIHSIIIR